MIQPQPSPATHESAFIERYERLYKSALILTKHNQDQAEDLLHDAFVQFSLSHPDLQSIQNLDGYLYRVLRNMRVSQMRRATRLQEATLVLSGTSLENILSLPDHSSLERGLNSVEQKAQEQVQDELRRICQYAVARKASSKAGSVVMLRFFLGYYPEEIAQILKSPRAVIDKALQRARGEARLYLAEPDSLSFIRGNPTSEPLGEVEPGKTLSEFLQNLRAAVYSSEQDACLSAKTIRGWYTTKPSASISGPNTKALSHVVSCPKCLDEINRTLGLPLLSTRHPADMGRRDPRKPRKGGKDGGGASGGTSGGDVRESFLDRSRKRLKEAFEHRPQELRICVNGFLLGSQRINAELNEQTLSIKGEDKVGFVEVFSEREVRLLFYCVESPPDGPVEHHQRVDLSAGRSLELSLDFSAESPNLEVLYRDPTLAVEGIAEAEELDSAYSAIDERAESKLSLLADLKLQSVSLWKRALERQSWLRPAPVTALVALTLVCALLIGRLVSLNPGVPSAADLLQRASLAETALESRTDQVLHRTINVEERRVAQTSVCDGCGDLIARRKIEIWQSAEKGITARRLYDEKNVLIAGDWRRSDGVQTLYHHGAKPQLQLAPEKRAAAPLAFADVWQLDPSAKAFSSLLANAGQARVEERENTYVISAESAESVDNSVRVSTASGSDRISTSLTKATLILSKTDLHPIEQTLFITQGDQTREYKFTETSFEQKAASAVSPVVFEPEPELLSSVKLETPNSKLETSSLSSSPLAATTGLEVHVLDLLHSVSADISEQLNVTRTADGRLTRDPRGPVAGCTQPGDQHQDPDYRRSGPCPRPSKSGNDARHCRPHRGRVRCSGGRFRASPVFRSQGRRHRCTDPAVCIASHESFTGSSFSGIGPQSSCQSLHRRATSDPRSGRSCQMARHSKGLRRCRPPRDRRTSRRAESGLWRDVRW